MRTLFTWDIYEISSPCASLNGVMLRGRIRKFGLENKQNILAENTEDVENGVRFAVLAGEDASFIIAYLKTIIPDASVEQVAKAVQNPVLSKLKVNESDRYKL